MKSVVFFAFYLALSSVWNAVHSRDVAICNKDISKSRFEASNANHLSGLENCFCGAVATFASDLLLFPIDTVKVQQQSIEPTKGLFQTLRGICARQGVLGLYDGVAPFLLCDSLGGAAKFAVYDQSKRWVEERLSSRWHAMARFLSGGVSMASCAAIIVPGEVIKTRIQAGQAKSIFDAVRSTLHAEGAKGLFAGFGATLLRDVPYTMIEFGLYENIKSALKKRQGRPLLGQCDVRDDLCAAAIAGGFAAFVTTPLDLVKTRMMLQSPGAQKGAMEVFQSIYRTGGVRSLFTGAFARVGGLVPFTMLHLGLYGATTRALQRRRREREAAGKTSIADNGEQDQELIA